MDFQKIKDKVRYIAGNCGDFIALHKRYFLAGCIFICMACVLFLGTGKSATQEKTAEGVYKNYKENKNEELDKLINDYYKAYASGDTDSLKKLADPVSDQEVSYIQFYSQYIDSFNNIKIFTKDGLEKGSYLCSVRVDLKYKDIETEAPGLDFFYVETKDDKLFINNIYGSFNQTNNIYEMDTEVSDLISVFIRQQDKLDKEAEVTEAYEDAIDKDASLATFMSETLPAAIVQWNSDYQVQLAAAAEEAAKAEEEAKAKAEEEAKAAEEAAKAEEEEANSFTGKTNAKANVRAEADKNSERLGSVQKGTEITIYGEEGDFYKFDYNGTKAYITKDAVNVSNGDTAEETQEEETEETPTVTQSFNKGDKIRIKSTTNIRSKMDTSSSKVAVAYDGDEVEVIMSYAEGWTKVKFKKKEGFIRTDLLSK